jgi:hypothetical protein
MKRRLDEVALDPAVSTTIEDLMPELLNEVDTFLTEREDKLSLMTSSKQLRLALRAVFVGHYAGFFGELIALAQRTGLAGLNNDQRALVNNKATFFTKVPVRLFLLEHWHGTSPKMESRHFHELHEFYIETYGDDMGDPLDPFIVFLDACFGTDMGPLAHVTFAEALYRIVLLTSHNYHEQLAEKLLNIWWSNITLEQRPSWKAHVMFASAFVGVLPNPIIHPSMRFMFMDVFQSKLIQEKTDDE